MTIEIKIAFRKLLSDCLMYMTVHADSRNEVLTTLDKLETAIAAIVDQDITMMLPLSQLVDRVPYQIGETDQTDFRRTIAVTLEMLGKPNVKPENVLQLIKNLETWVENLTERELRAVLGKPKMTISKLPN